MIRRLLPILGITFVDILGFSILIPTLPYLALHFKVAPVLIGVLFSTFSLCQLIAGPLWGNVSDRIGRKAVLIISQIGATIGWGMLGFAPNIWFVFLSRIVEGVSGGNIGVTQAYVADLVAPKERARAFSYISATFAMGMTFGPLIASFFIRYGFWAPMTVAAGLQFVTLILTIFLLPESRSKADNSGIVGASEIFRTFANPVLAPMLWQKLALSLCLYAWFSAVTLFLAFQLHFGTSDTYYFFSAFALVNVLSNVGGVGKASDKLGDRTMTMLGIVMLIGGFALVPFVHVVLTMVAVMILFSLGMAFANTGITALISAASSDRLQGTVLGVTSSLDSVAGIVSPPISTGLLGKFGSPWASAASLFFAVIALVLGLWLREGKDKSGAHADAASPATADV